jgi:hypothetical protein
MTLKAFLKGVRVAIAPSGADEDDLGEALVV